MKENKASWTEFFKWLKSRGLAGVRLVVGDKCLDMLEAVGKVFPEDKYQRCVVHFYQNVFSAVPRSKGMIVAKALKEMKLKEAAGKAEGSIEETLTYMDFPFEHWTRIRTNNAIEHLNREIRRRTRVGGTFPDSNSALCLFAPGSAMLPEHIGARRNT